MFKMFKWKQIDFWWSTNWEISRYRDAASLFTKWKRNDRWCMDDARWSWKCHISTQTEEHSKAIQELLRICRSICNYICHFHTLKAFVAWHVSTLQQHFQSHVRHLCSSLCTIRHFLFSRFFPFLLLSKQNQHYHAKAHTQTDNRFSIYSILFIHWFSCQPIVGLLVCIQIDVSLSLFYCLIFFLNIEYRPALTFIT